MSSTHDAARSTDDVGLLGAGLALEGTLRGRGSVRIEGTLSGQVDLDGAVTLGPQAQVSAPIRARSIDVHGEVHGALAADEVSVRAGGWVEGDVRARTLSIDDGATVEGLVDMDVDADPRAATRAR